MHVALCRYSNICIFLPKFSGTVQETIDDFMLTDVYTFLHFCLHLHMYDLRSVMLQINEYDDDDDDYQ